MRAPDQSRALSTSEAVLWRTESPALRLPVIAMLTLDTSPDWARLRRAVQRLLHGNALLRSRPAEPALGVGRPRWAPVRDLDLSCHLRRVRLPAPYDPDHAVELARTMAMTPFDPSRPLWEVVLGLTADDGEAVLLCKMHHAIADGFSALRMLAALCEEHSPGEHSSEDPAQVPLRVVPAPAQDGPLDTGPGRCTPAGLVGAALSGARSLAGAVTDRPLSLAAPLLGTAARTTALLRSSASALFPPAPPSPVLRGRSTSRTLRIMEVPREALRDAGRLVGGTTHDAYLTGVLGGLRHYQTALGTGSRSVPMAVAVALPPKGAADGSNRFSGLRMAGPVGEPDPLLRLRAVHAAVRAARATPPVDPDGLGPLSRLLASAPAPCVRLLAGHLAADDVHCTYVPGPERSLSLAGTGVRRLHPFAPVVNCALSVAMFSYDGTCAIGMNMDSAAVRQPDLLHSSLVTGFEEVTSLVRS
ncbi:wax ester/triacylglycerol synthase domain-containing protein [Streptomyces gobitricini]|uniref:diacylglycerol O-acyltransferase n=1 Tax=Streptomyces gobitricini TaxID=68211 RepID=A0ABN3N4E7_9ACTN